VSLWRIPRHIFTSPRFWCVGFAYTALTCGIILPFWAKMVSSFIAGLLGARWALRDLH